jgi:hypothetical protein
MNHKSGSNTDELKNTIFDAMIAAGEAQVRALRMLRKKPIEKITRKRVGMSQLDLIEDILARARAPLHISNIIEQVANIHAVHLDRESVVSALSKKVTRNERFVRTEKNTFTLKGGKP